MHPVRLHWLNVISNLNVTISKYKILFICPKHCKGRYAHNNLLSDKYASYEPVKELYIIIVRSQEAFVRHFLPAQFVENAADIICITFSGQNRHIHAGHQDITVVCRKVMVCWNYSIIPQLKNLHNISNLFCYYFYFVLFRCSK